MKNGMSLEQFKAQLDTDAQEKVKELEAKLAQAEALLQKRDKEAYFLFNRCETLSNGHLCTYCGMKTRCSLIRAYFDGENKGVKASEHKKV